MRLATYMSRAEALVARSLLEEHGISLRMKTDDMGGLQPALTLTGGVELWVAEEDFADAIRLLNLTPDEE